MGCFKAGIILGSLMKQNWRPMKKERLQVLEKGEVGVCACRGEQFGARLAVKGEGRHAI